jgi:hypothetical protein
MHPLLAKKQHLGHVGAAKSVLPLGKRAALVVAEVIL